MVSALRREGGFSKEADESLNRLCDHGSGKGQGVKIPTVLGMSYLNDPNRLLALPLFVPRPLPPLYERRKK